MNKKSCSLIILCFVLSMVSFTFCKKLSVLESLTINKNKIIFKANKQLKKYINQDLFVEYAQEINLEKLEYEIITMPFIMNIIPVIWISGERFFIDSMDKTLYDSLHIIKKIFKVQYPNTRWDGELMPLKLNDLDSHYRHVCTLGKKAVLYSGGLDSTSSFLAHNQEDIETITAWGAYDLPLSEEQIWRDRKQKITEFVQSHGHTAHFFKSNYYDFLKLSKLDDSTSDIYSWRLCCAEAIGWAGLVAPILAATGCSILYAPSSGHWDYPWPDCTNPFVENSIKFASFKVETDQFELNRFGKNQTIVNECRKFGYEKPFIKVCQWTQKSGDLNCCNCRKCLTTIMGFLALEEDPRDYGFPIACDEAIFRVMRFLSNKEGCNHFDIDNFRAIHYYLNAKMKQNHLYAKELKPFIDLNFNKIVIADKKYLRSFPWETLTPINSAVKMPASYRKNLFEPVTTNSFFPLLEKKELKNEAPTEITSDPSSIHKFLQKIKELLGSYNQK